MMLKAWFDHFTGFVQMVGGQDAVEATYTSQLVRNQSGHGDRSVLCTVSHHAVGINSSIDLTSAHIQRGAPLTLGMNET